MTTNPSTYNLQICKPTRNEDKPALLTPYKDENVSLSKPQLV